MTNEEAIRILREYQYGGGDGMTHFGPHSFDLTTETVEHIIAVLERDRWISVEEPPEETGRYLVRYLRDIDIEDGIHDDRIVIMRFLKNSGWRYPLICNKDVRQCVTMEAVTHWRPLQEPPKENKP